MTDKNESEWHEEIRKEHPEHLDALEFMSSARGFFILGQAVYIAIQTLSNFPERDKPTSNIEDLKYLRKHLFNLPGELVDPLAWGAADVASLYEVFMYGELEEKEEFKKLVEMKRKYRHGK